MNALDCKTFLNLAGDWMEGNRPAAAEAHLRECARCRGVVTDLEAIRATCTDLAEGHAEPPARVWTAVHARLVEEGLIRGAKGRSRLADVFGWMPRPILAAGYLALLVAAGLAVPQWTAPPDTRQAWLTRTEATVASVETQLGAAEQDTQKVVSVTASPEVTTTFHQNLAVVDNAIVLCEKTVRDDPENEMARDFLYDAYQQKATLLAAMTERGVNGQ